MQKFKDVAFLTRASNQTKKTYYLRGLKKELTMRVLQNEIPNQFKDKVNLTRKHVESMEYKQETTTPRRNHTTSLEPQKRKRRSEETDNNLCFYCREPGHWARDCLILSFKKPKKILLKRMQRNLEET